MCTFWSSHSKACSVGMEGSDTWWMSPEFRDLRIVIFCHVVHILNMCEQCVHLFGSEKNNSRNIFHFESEVFQASWWMYHYGSTSPKRHVIFSNSSHVSKLSMGRLLGWKAASNHGRKPCRSYKGKDGKRRFHGTRHLKRTEKLVSMFGAHGIPWEDL